MRNLILIAAASTALIAAPSAASASPMNSTEFSATVEHDDLDLTTQRGIARLDERVRTEIRRACANGARDSASLRLERQCRASALASAEQGIRIAVAEANADRVRFAENTSTTSEAAPSANTPDA